VSARLRTVGRSRGVRCVCLRACLFACLLASTVERTAHASCCLFAATVHGGARGVLKGYSRGTHGVLEGCSWSTLGVLEGYSRHAARLSVHA
jgi:hypothetical protein